MKTSVCNSLERDYYLLDATPRPCDGCELRTGCKSHCVLYNKYVAAGSASEYNAAYLKALKSGEGRGEFAIPPMEMIYQSCKAAGETFKNGDVRIAYKMLYRKELAAKTVNSYLRKLVAAGKLRKLSDFEYELV